MHTSKNCSVTDELNARLAHRQKENRPWYPEEMDRPTLTRYIANLLKEGLDFTAT